MLYLLVAFLSSFIATLIIIRFNHLHDKFSSDSDLLGPQKFHTHIVPRIGGIGIAIGILTAILLRFKNNPVPDAEITLLACAIPTFAIGLTEDLTKKISVRMRLIFTAIAATLLVILVPAQITRLDIPFVDPILAIPVIGALLAVFAITGLANAYNIIDGFNGLSSMVGIITLLAIAYVSFVVADPLLMYLSLIMAAAILGFFIWNYPSGLIFLGDGGAYLIGFWIASISVMITYRHQEISPWFALLINGYPIAETLYTIYRRKIHQGKSPGQPDGIHFHSLIYRRILRPRHYQGIFSANAKTAPYLWGLTILGIAPAVLWRESTPKLITASLGFIICYAWLYSKIVRLKTPRWMHPK
jgi:UDP-N-acetylmuramyl pentapeptide phosphotransferase/UDP-N-acetylglucosamine-1-phosphate transferase